MYTNEQLRQLFGSVRLNESIPNAIKAYSQVLHFPYESSLVKVIAQQPDFREAIEYLCAFENSAPDKIECVAAVLLGAWVSSDKSGVSVREILIKAQQSTPSLIFSFSTLLRMTNVHLLGK